MKILIKLKTNQTWKLDNFGRLETDILRQLFKEPKITKKKSNVTESIENMLYDGCSVTSIQYDLPTAQVILYLKPENNEKS